MLPVHRALLSVSDKTGLEDLARGLVDLGIEIVSTGGTARALREAGVPVVPVAEATGFPEILDGRVKTLHPHIHGGILADRHRASHLSQLKEHGMTPIDLVVVNLYPFEATVARKDATYTEIVEMIDIGGPTMVRAAAKNHGGVAVVVDPRDYPAVLEALQAGDRTIPKDARQRLAAKAFDHTRAYDTAVSLWLAGEAGLEREPFPERLSVELERVMVPRYGENPHQSAAVYQYRGGSGLFDGMRQLQGKELSWNNLLDADAARRMVAGFAEPAVVIVKHNNPCGVGRGQDLKQAYKRALATDSLSAFGSIIALNRPADGPLAEAMRKLFVEVVIAPEFDADAREIFGAKTNLRLLECPVFAPPRSGSGEVDLRSVSGGLLAQDLDVRGDDPATWECVTRRKPRKAERAALEMAWLVSRAVKSNAIVLANAHQTVGIGAGQMSRVDSCRLAIDKARQAKLKIVNCAAASDAFFPFADGLEVLAEAGVTAVVQPGGSKRDDEVIAAAEAQGLAMLFTGTRHFRH